MSDYQTALVTGGAGFIGSHVVDALIERGIDVTVVDNLSTGNRSNIHPKADFHEMSILSPNFSTLVQELQPDILFHFAAQINVRESVDDPPMDAEVNVLGTIKVAHHAAAAGTKKIIFASTGGAMFGDEHEPPHPESRPADPKSPYGIAKRSGELYVRFVGEHHDVPTTSLRLANVYGPRQDATGEAGVVSIFSELMLADKPVTIFGDGEQTRDFVYIDDVVHAFLAAMDRDAPGVFHIGTGKETSVNDLFESLKDITGTDLAPQSAPAKHGEVKRSALDASRAKTVLEWEPRVTIDDGLQKTVEWMEQEMV